MPGIGCDAGSQSTVQQSSPQATVSSSPAGPIEGFVADVLEFSGPETLRAKVPVRAASTVKWGSSVYLCADRHSLRLWETPLAVL